MAWLHRTSPQTLCLSPDLLDLGHGLLLIICLGQILQLIAEVQGLRAMVLGSQAIPGMLGEGMDGKTWLEMERCRWFIDTIHGEYGLESI